MNDRSANADELSEILGPDPVKKGVAPGRLFVAPVPTLPRHPFKEYTYDELTNAPKKSYLCGDDDHPVLLSEALWQTMGLLKSAKTYFCMELGFCIAFGFDFHGLKTKEGNVAYIIAEGGIGRNFERVKALCAKYESELREKFEVREGNYIAAAMQSGKFNLIDSPVDLASTEPEKGLGVGILLGQLAHRPYVAIFLDTWARMLWASGGHDSDQNTVGPAVQGCDHIRRALGCTVVMVAHIGVSKDAQGRAKGLSDPAGAIDGATICRKSGDGPLAQYTFSATYQRHAVDGFSISAQLRPCGQNVALMSDGVSNLIKLKIPDRKMLEVLQGLEPGATRAEWLMAVTRSKIPGRRGASLEGEALRKAFKRAADRLEKAGAIEVEGDIVYVKTGAGGDPMIFGTAEDDFPEEED